MSDIDSAMERHRVRTFYSAQTTSSHVMEQAVPGQRKAQYLLAEEVTELVHGSTSLTVHTNTFNI